MTQRPDMNHGLDSLEQFIDARRAEPEMPDAPPTERANPADPRGDDPRRGFAVIPDPAIRVFEILRSRFAGRSPDDPLLDDRRFPDSETVLRFPNESVDEVWRKLALDGDTLDIAAHSEPRLVSPDERREALRATLDLHAPAPRLEAAPPAELFLSRLRTGRGTRRLRTTLSAPVLGARLETIIDEVALHEEETGRAALFLIFGVLEWRRPENPDTPCRAPLLLLPVHLERRTEHGRAAYALNAASETAERNPALLDAFQTTFDHALPTFRPEPASATPVSAWFDAVDAAVADLDGFAVRRFLTLGGLRIGRRVLYDDLDLRRLPEHPTAHPLVGPILRTLADPQAARPSEMQAPDDDGSEAVAPLLVHGADSVEHAALADAVRGRNPVILTPPGTTAAGTIANIVADTMARGKTVLVLSEKQAALEAVKARLDDAGLGLFCLEAHGQKVSPKAILRQLRDRMGPQLPRAAPPRPDLAARDAAAKDLAAYASALHAVQEDGETVFSLIWRYVAASAEHGSATRAFRGVEIPAPFLHNPAEAARVGRELARHTEAVIAYERAFGSPRATPWARLDLDTLTPEAAAGILTNLDEAHRAALELADLLRQTADFGLSGLGDLRQVMTASLPVVSDLSAVAEVVGLDLDRLAEAVTLRRTILACQEDLVEAATLMDIDDVILGQAAEMAVAARTCAFSEVPPAEAFSRAENEMRDAQQLAAAMSALVGTLALLGFDENAESRLLMGVAAAVSIASSIPPVLRPWMSWSPPGPPERFESATDRGKQLGAAEEQWRQDVPGYDSAARPRPDELRDAAAALRRAGVKRIFSSFSGDLKTARALCEMLDIDAPEEDLPDLLESLAAHVEAANAFDVDEDAARAIGSAWAGVDTPFDLMGGAVRVRGAIREGLAEFHSGPEIADRMLKLDERGVTEFGAFAPAAMVFRAIPGARTLGRENVQNSVRRYEDVIVRLTAFVGRDPDGAFSPIALPIERVATLAEREIERRRLVEELSQNPTAEVLDDARLDAMTDAGTWLRGLADLVLPAPLKDQLVSTMAAETRRRLFGLNQRADDPFRRLTDAIEELTRFGLSEVGSDDVDFISRQASEFLRSGAALPDFLQLHSRRARLEGQGLGAFLARAEEGRVRPEDIGPIFSHLALRRRIEALRQEFPALGRSGAALEARRRAYSDQDRAKMEKDRAALRGRLFTGAHDSERARIGMRILERELRRERGLSDLGLLMQEAGAAMQALKPCVLASPLTLAEHFSHGVAFDLVVIAEGSQMPVSLAMGGLLRAKALVVTGDPAGLPPRDFLSDDPDSIRDEEAAVDGLSVLDACAAAFGTIRRLGRREDNGCESLLAFSNRIVYGSDVSLLPGPAADSFAIDLVRTEGEEEGGRNEVEALRIAEEAIDFMRRFADHDEAGFPTLGVVAATPAQGALIRETMLRLEEGDDRLMRYRDTAARRGEPFFVKSLDNVQGDRRDCLLVSLVYGRAAAAGAGGGQRRLGPFSDRHGERRLNVLTTRARIRLGVVASIGSADLHLDDAASGGERLLQAWLAYVEKRGQTPEFQQANVRVRAPLPAVFETELVSRIRARGYELASRIGLSGTDSLMGVRHTSRPEIWLAGLEADGATHRPSTNARDRDRLRDEALRGLGWDVLRVWSTDWFDDPDLQTSRLMIHLEGLRRKETIPAETFFRFEVQTEVEPPVEEDLHEPEVRETGGTAA